MAKQGLTEPQYKAYQWIKGFIQEKGFSPSGKDIKNGCGLISVSSAHSLVSQLVKRGYLIKGKGRRNINIVGE